MPEFANSIKLLRFPFSLFLLPVTLFSFYFIQPEISLQLFLVLIIWHLLVYPSSNGYNSYHDRDESPIGGLERPPQPPSQLLFICNAFDLVAIGLAFLVNPFFALFVFVYIVISRLYSNRQVRLKKFALLSFVLVFLFQGMWIFLANIFAFSSAHLLLDDRVLLSALTSSFFIGTLYPLTQIYQHESDKKSGVKTLSMLLGHKGTFLFSATMFLIATLLVFITFNIVSEEKNTFLLFNFIMLPAIAFFLFWAAVSYKDPSRINFKNAMLMLLLSSTLINIYFLILLF